MAKKAAVLRDQKRQKMYDKYKDKRAELKAAGDLEGLQKLPRNSSPTRLKNRDLLDKLVAYAKERGIEPDYAQIATSRNLLEKSLYSNITYQILGMLEHVKYANLDDPTVLKAVEVLESGKAWPDTEGKN